MKTVREWQEEAFEIAESKGMHERTPFDRAGTLLRLCLIHTEVSETAQVVKRRGLEKRDEIAEEMADTCIRIFDLAEGLGIDLEIAIAHKMARNRLRAYRYGTPEEGNDSRHD